MFPLDSGDLKICVCFVQDNDQTKSVQFTPNKPIDQFLYTVGNKKTG